MFHPLSAVSSFPSLSVPYFGGVMGLCSSSVVCLFLWWADWRELFTGFGLYGITASSLAVDYSLQYTGGSVAWLEEQQAPWISGTKRERGH